METGLRPPEAITTFTCCAAESRQQNDRECPEIAVISAVTNEGIDDQHHWSGVWQYSVRGVSGS